MNSLRRKDWSFLRGKKSMDLQARWQKRIAKSLTTSKKFKDYEASKNKSLSSNSKLIDFKLKELIEISKLMIISKKSSKCQIKKRMRLAKLTTINSDSRRWKDRQPKCQSGVSKMLPIFRASKDFRINEESLSGLSGPF